MTDVVFLKLQSPTVKIQCVAVGPDGTDTLDVTFKRYPTDIAEEKMSAFNAVRFVEPIHHKKEGDLVDGKPVTKDELEAANQYIDDQNKRLQKEAETGLAKILFSEIVDIDGLHANGGGPISYKDASDDDKAAIYRQLNMSNPYIRALVEGYLKALVNVGEARSKN